LPLRVQVGSNDSFSAVLSRVREGALEAYAHQDVPFSQIVEDLAPERRPDAPPLVQVTFELNSTTSEVGSAEPAGRSVEDHLNILKEIDTGGVPVRFELEVYGWERAGGIGLTWIYNRALFDRPWVEQLARDYVRLLTAVAADSTQPVAAVALESAAPAPVVVAPPDRTLLDRIEAQVAARPTAVAVRCGAETLSYAALDAEANRLAQALRAQGLGPEQIVAVVLPRSLALVVALLGVAKTGAAFLLLDPALPAQRLAHILET